MNKAIDWKGISRMRPRWIGGGSLRPWGVSHGLWALARRTVLGMGNGLGTRKRQGLGLLATLSVVLSMVTVAVWPATLRASYVDVLANGGFEQGFGSEGGCGMVGLGWQCFTNGGRANYGFYDDQWERTVAAGKHSQLIEINTKGMMEATPTAMRGSTRQ